MQSTWLRSRLAREYRARFGSILHHSVDKALLRGGMASPAFGGGTVLAPIEIYLSGRVVLEAGGKTIPIKDNARGIARMPEMRFLCRS